jgi:acyl-CoA hydrolase
MKVVSIEQLSAVLADLPDNPRVIASGNVATPTVLLDVLDRQIPTYRLHMLNAQRGIPDRDGVTYETTFIGPGMRGSERLQYVPCRLSLVPILYRDHYRPDVVLLHTSARHHDTVSLGLETNVLPAAIDAAREHGGLVVAQANPQMPYTYGDAQIYENDIDYLVEVDEPIPTPGGVELSDVSRRIGELIAAHISSGSTLQMGIGAVPDAVLESLTQATGLSIWTEMFSDGVLTLDKRGQLDPDVPVTASFAMGSRELYDWMDGNRRVRMLRTEHTNDPGVIARQRLMTSVNAALQVDLFDQANASWVKSRIYSGFGGSTDFIVGALHARGGQSFMALPSWHPKANVSTIVPFINEPVTSFQHTYVATENGLARTFGLSQADQAANIIDKAAHPNARDALREAAMGFGLLK